MIRWVVKKPRYGDHIRVSRGYYYHHGIYFWPWRVVHFSAFNQPGAEGETASDKACIISTSYKDFHRGDRVEVREFTPEEKKNKRKWWQISRIAKSELGKRKGTYSLLRNNCEHFVNEVLFGVKYSEQTAHPIRHVLQLGDQQRLKKEHEQEKERQRNRPRWWHVFVPSKWKKKKADSTDTVKDKAKKKDTKSAKTSPTTDTADAKVKKRKGKSKS